MKLSFSSFIASALMLFVPAVCAAQQQAPAAPAAATTAKAPALSDDAKKAKAKECSAEADAKKLHGKERKEFRSKCKRG
ncbi:MAG: PsiF family protein [Methylocella sp.]